MISLEILKQRRAFNIRSFFQQVLDRVKPARAEQKRDSYRTGWWQFAETRVNLRKSSAGLARFVATCRTAKHRVFGFLEADILPDAKLIAICLDDAWLLAVLSSRFHISWAPASGAFLENRPNYNHAQCFNPFPFPTPSEPLKAAPAATRRRPRRALQAAAGAAPQADADGDV